MASRQNYRQRSREEQGYALQQILVTLTGAIVWDVVDVVDDSEEASKGWWWLEGKDGVKTDSIMLNRV